MESLFGLWLLLFHANAEQGNMAAYSDGTEGQWSWRAYSADATLHRHSQLVVSHSYGPWHCCFYSNCWRLQVSAPVTMVGNIIGLCPCLLFHSPCWSNRSHHQSGKYITNLLQPFGSEWTSTHKCTMQDGWCVGMETLFHCIPVPVANQSG
jgi:hypothetical protein